MSKFRDNLLRSLYLLVRNSVKEIEEQGHKASGKGIRSFEVKVIEGGPVLIGQVIGEDYLVYLDTGTRPHYVPIGPLLRWVRKIKGVPARERVSRAYKVQKSIARVGTPSPGSFRFSKNGRRTNWSRFAQIASEGDMEKILEESDGDVELLLEDIINGIERVRVV